MQFTTYKKRILLVSLAIILIVLAFYDNHNNGESYRLEKKKLKEWNIGGVYVRHFDNYYFYAESLNDTIVGINYKKVMPKGEVLQVGDLIKIKSIHLNGDTVDVKFINISRSRPAKIWLSVIPVIIIFFLFFKYFRFNKKRFIFEEN